MNGSRPPAEALVRLVPADARHDGRGEEAVQVWHGVVWGRLGRGDVAWDVWTRVHEPTLTSWLEAERGRVLRELGLHGSAEEHDLRGLRRATDPVDEAMLWIGLTADAVGLGETGEAVLRLAAARDATDAAPDGPRRDRQLLRLTWVETEVAVLTGEERPGGPWPERRGDTLWWPREFAAGTDFHRAKAALFLGAVQGDMWWLDQAVALSPPILLWAAHLARSDLGAAGALEAAREAWGVVRAPAHVVDAVAGTPTAARLGS